MSIVALSASLARSRKIPTPVLLAVINMWTVLRRRRANTADHKRQWKIVARFTFRALVSSMLPRSKFRTALLPYLWLRFVDDVMDGDAPAPRGHSYASYLTRKAALVMKSRHVEEAEDFEDELIVRMARDGEACGVDTHAELAEIWSVMCEGNAKWGLCVSAAELHNRAKRTDSAILSVVLKAFGAYDTEEPLHFVRGVFTRMEVLADIVGDLSEGRINIPLETIDRYQFDVCVLKFAPGWETLREMSGFLFWYREEIVRMEDEWRKTSALLQNEFERVLPPVRARFAHWLVSQRFKHYVSRAKARLT